MQQRRFHKGKALWWALLLAVIAAGAVYYLYFMQPREPAPEPPTLPPPVVSQPAAEPEPEPEPERLPPPATEPEAPVEVIEPLPALPESDDEALAAAGELLGETPARTYLVTDAVLPRLVAAVDALTNEELPQNVLPVRAPGGEFEATADGVSEDINPETGLPEPQFILDPVNFQRYTSQVEVLEAIDTEALIGQYRRYYPLLQQSYSELGYPDGEFDDRLLQVIDHLLATPEPERPVRLIKPEAFYEFADPELEALSAGQKLLIRMGPSNAARVKAKLSEIRNALQTQRE